MIIKQVCIHTMPRNGREKLLRNWKRSHLILSVLPLASADWTLTGTSPTRKYRWTYLRSRCDLICSLKTPNANLTQLIFLIDYQALNNRNSVTCFSPQVQLACKLQKPMLLHERDAFREMNEILNKYQTMLPPVVIHCFTGSRQEAIKYVGMGCYIGITGRFFLLS